MSRADERAVAIIGSGVAGTAFARSLTAAGIDVVVFEKGPPYPYPHAQQFRDQLNLWRDPAHDAPADVAGLTSSGVYVFPLEAERAIVEGGAGTHWSAITLRMRPNDFRTRTLFGFGSDWPIDYDTLEPYYGQAERLLGVSGTDTDNPFAPPRSTDYPLPPFELGPSDHVIAERLGAAGIHLHSTPQARTRHAFDRRPGCQNYGMCMVCPIGARYSPNHHLAEARATGRCTVHTNTSVRRVITDRSGRATGLLVQHNDEAEPREHPVRWVVLAGGTLESVRLLLLSTGVAWPDGLGNARGRLGSGLSFHHYWWNDFVLDRPVYAGRFGGYTGQTHQFMDPPGRGRHGGLKIELGAMPNAGGVRRWGSWEEVEPQIMERRSSWPLILSGETLADPARSITLSRRSDRFGDPFAHVHYELVAFDHETFAYAREVHDRIAAAIRAEPTQLNGNPNRFGSGAHHMGGCAMSESAADGVVDSFGRVHGAHNVYVAGSALFPGSSGAVNPTLTLLALAFRAAEHLIAQVTTA